MNCLHETLERNLRNFLAQGSLTTIEEMCRLIQLEMDARGTAARSYFRARGITLHCASPSVEMAMGLRGNLTHSTDR